MNKIYYVEHSGSGYYMDELGIRHYYFDMLVNDINERDFDTIEWLDNTRDLDSQLDLIRFTKYGDIKDIIEDLKKSESMKIEEIKTYKALLEFYREYLQGKITNYRIYNNIGLPFYMEIEEIEKTLEEKAKEEHLTEYDKLITFIDTKAFEIIDFKKMYNNMYKNILQDFIRDLEIVKQDINFYNNVNKYKIGEDYLEKLEKIQVFLKKMDENIKN